MKLAMLEVAKAFDSGYGLGKAPEDDPSFPAKQRYHWVAAHVHDSNGNIIIVLSDALNSRDYLHG